MNIKKIANITLEFTINRLIEIFGIIILSFGILLFIALISYSPNDPNFIFENDPSYQGVKLWDQDGNAAFVNSFLECEHYVSGGWVQSPTSSLISESNLQLILGAFVVALFIVKIFTKFYSRSHNV